MLTTDKALWWCLVDADALKALWVGTCGLDGRLKPPRHQPLRKPVQLAVAQKTITLNMTEEKKTIELLQL